MDIHAFLQAFSLVLSILVTICYFYQFVYLVVPFILKRRLHKEEKRNRYAILIAARNEEAVLPHLLNSIHAQDYPAELLSIFVVADNCTDRTAELARAHGATVFSRTNHQQVGKGYALNYLIAQIDRTVGLSQFDAFLVFDADNLLEPDYITQINRVCSDGYEAFCGYRNSKNFGTNWITSGYGHWFLRESAYMNRARMLLGASCVVNGTGFGFTRQLLQRMGGWNFFTLSEDTEFSAWCSVNGVRVGYCHDAVLYDEQPQTFRVSVRQRTRWAQGGIQVSVRYGLSLLRGLFTGGKTSWFCFETLTLGLWGCLLGTVAVCLSLTVAFINGSWNGLLLTLLQVVTNAYGLLFIIAACVLLLERRRIRATAGQKIASVFTFPLFMMTFVPIAVTAVFRKYEWPPIEHTVAISSEELLTK